MMRRLFSAILCFSLVLACSISANAVNQSEVTEAASYLRERGVMVGNQDGDMMLDSGLTRTELAVLLTQSSRELLRTEVAAPGFHLERLDSLSGDVTMENGVIAIPRNGFAVLLYRGRVFIP